MAPVFPDCAVVPWPGPVAGRLEGKGLGLGLAEWGVWLTFGAWEKGGL